jgi:hypothetical protein
MSKPRKEIAALIEELKSWLPNYNHGPTEYPTILFRTLAAAPGGDRLEDMGYEPIGNLGWHELDQLGRVLEAIQDKRDVEDLVAGLVDDEEDLEEARRPARDPNYQPVSGPFDVIDRHGKPVAGPFHRYGDAKRKAEQIGGTVQRGDRPPTARPTRPARPARARRPPSRRK